jgi:hypothetical protein
MNEKELTPAAPQADGSNGADARAAEPQNADEEFYAEPATLGGREAAGVVVALLALLVIGVAGYIWLTPGMSVAKLVGAAGSRPAAGGAGALARAEPSAVRGPKHAVAESSGGNNDGSAVAAGAAPSAPPPPAVEEHGPAANPPAAGSAAGRDRPQPAGATPAQPAADGAGPVPTGEAILAAANGERNATCAQCGMPAGKSYGEVVAQWNDGSIEHFDSWSCAFARAKAKGQRLQAALVLQHGSTPSAPQWLTAKDAWFVYNTKSIKGSMPPFVAAFDTKDAAEAAQAQDGGQAMDWEGLQAKFK